MSHFSITIDKACSNNDIRYRLILGLAKEIMTNKEYRESGFTLIELMAVVLILGIMSAIAIPILRDNIKTAVQATLISDVREAAYQMEKDAITSANGAYPQIISANYHHSENNNIVLVEDDYSDLYSICIIGKNEQYVDLYAYYSSDERIVRISEFPRTNCGTGESYKEGALGTEPQLPAEENPTPSEPPVVENSEPTQPPTGENTQPPVDGGTETPQPPTDESTETPQPPVVEKPVVNPPVKQPPAPIGYSDPKRKKYNICHNGNTLNLPLPGIVNGHAGHSYDIIPPIPQAYPTGLNWTTTGAATWYNNCKPV